MGRLAAAQVWRRGPLSVQLAAFRSIRGSPCDAAQIDFLGRAAHHLHRAVETMARLGAVTDPGRASMEVMERLEMGVFLFDLAGRAVHVNAAGRALAQGDGLRLRRGQLVATDARENAELQRAVRLAGSTGGGCGGDAGALVRVSRPSGAEAYELTVAPLGRGREPMLASPRRPVAVVFVRDPAEPGRARCGDIAEDFGLTPAETALAVAVARGEGLPRAASSLEISVNTAKTQLRSVFWKTGVQRQAELVALIASKPTS